MIRALRVLILRARESSLLGQIQHGEALLLEHRARLIACHGALRRVRSEIATKESPKRMLAQALRQRALSRST